MVKEAHAVAKAIKKYGMGKLRERLSDIRAKLLIVVWLLKV